MNSSRLSVVLTLLALGIAFLMGRYSMEPSTKPAPSAATSTASAAVVQREETTLGRLLFGANAEPDHKALTPEQVRVQTFELLATPDTRQRLRLVLEMLQRMDKGNWRDIQEAFLQQTALTGRTHDIEWRLMLHRVGEVAGREAIEAVLADGKNLHRLDALASGWATADPRAAMDWLATLPAEQQARLAGAFVVGLANSDPEAALSYIGTRMPEQREGLMGRVVEGLIQREGFQRAEEMLPGLQARTDIPSSIKGAFYWQIADRQIRMARIRNDPEAVLAWVDRTPAGLAGPAAMRDIVTFAAASNAPKTFDWVLERSAQWQPEQIDRVYPAIAAAYQKQAPEEFAAWINAHPEHPQRDVFAIAVAQDILNKGDYDAAQQWAQSLVPGEARTKLEAMIAKNRAEKIITIPNR
jgi:hypothetical protein